jgi:hypothetical protein
MRHAYVLGSKLALRLSVRLASRNCLSSPDSLDAEGYCNTRDMDARCAFVLTSSQIEVFVFLNQRSMGTILTWCLGSKIR